MDNAVWDMKLATFTYKEFASCHLNRFYSANLSAQHCGFPLFFTIPMHYNRDYTVFLILCGTLR